MGDRGPRLEDKNWVKFNFVAVIGVRDRARITDISPKFTISLELHTAVILTIS